MASDIYRKLAEEALFGMILVEVPSGTIRYINPSAQNMLQVDSMPTEKAKQLSILFFFDSEVRSTPLLTREELFKLEGNIRDVTMKKLDGSVMIVNMGIKKLPAEANDSELVILSFQDMTMEKRLERDIELKQKGLRDALRELSEHNKELSKLDEAKTQFVYLVTHELRTPLTAMVSSAELLVAGVHDTPEDESMLKFAVYNQSLVLLEIVNDVLDLTKVKTGRMEYYIEAGDPRLLMHAVLQNFQDLSVQNQISFLVVDQLAPQCKAYFDPVRLRQVFSNLVSNSIKFSPIKSQVTVTFSNLERGVRMAIADQGIGIPKDLHHRVFSEFATLGEMRTHSKGTGLGLAICKNIVSAMGGSITFQSEEGRGSTFFVDIPTEKILDPVVYRQRKDGIVNLLDEVD